MAQRPVRERAALVLEHRREPDAQRRAARKESRERHARAYLQAPVPAPDADARRRGQIGGPHALAIVIEAVRGPVPGRREVEFAVAGGPLGGEEGLEAGVPPELVRAHPALP